jgi:type I restriction enzyme S subunit
MPEGWRSTTLGQVATIRRTGIDPSTNGDVPYIALEHIAQGAPRLLGWSSSSKATSNKTRFRQGDVLFGKLRPNLRKSVRAPFDGVCSTDILAILAADGLDPAYLATVCQAPKLQDFAIATSIGTKMPRTTWPQLATFPLLLPPLPEQRKIAEILSSVDDAIEWTETVIERVREVKRALAQELLTRGMPGRHTRYKQTEVGEIPEEWEVVRLGDVIDGVTYGTSAKCHVEPDGVPVLRIPNVASGEIDTTDLKYADINGTELAQLALRDGDLLVVRTNGNPNICGRFALVRELQGQWLFASYLLRIRPLSERLLPEFLELSLNARAGREQLKGSIRTSAGNYNLSATGLAHARLALPGTEEQSTICAMLSSVRLLAEREAAAMTFFGRLKRDLADALLTGQLRVPIEESD